jgi:hypothetical protein
MTVIGANIGTNLSWVNDWDTAKLPADLVWSARPWGLTNNGIGTWADVDSHGWPIVSTGTLFGALFESSPWPGTYKLSFTNRNAGTGDTVNVVNGSTVTLANRVHNADTNVTTYDIVVASYIASQFIWLTWNGSTGGITDCHLMRPLKDGSGWHAIGTALSDYIIDRLQNFSAIRTMATGGEGNKSSGTDTVWSGRTKPWSVQTRSSDSGRAGGVALENLILMANQTNKDLWITIPYRADDTYIENMAKVLRYGSDGITPYSSAQTSPVFAPLNSNLKLYVEHGNEIWNFGQPYWGGENYNNAMADIAAGDAHHLAYTSSSSGNWGFSWRQPGWLAVRQSLIFRSVFGDDAMMTKVRPVLATQHARFAVTSEPMAYLNQVWGQGLNTPVAYGVTNEFGNVARPVGYYIYALATAPYFPYDNSALDVTNASTMLDGTIASLESTDVEGFLKAVIWNHAQAAAVGIQYVAYEGGENLIPNLMPGGATTDNVANALLANYDPTQGARMGANIGTDGFPTDNQMGTAYGRVLSQWAAIGGQLFMHFTLSQGVFGLCPSSAQDVSDPRLETGPKWDAIKAFVKTAGSQPAPVVNAGSDQSITLPATASLSGTATDDGLPNPPGALTTTWSKVSGPGTVTFGDASATATTAAFSASGTYVLRLTATDSELAASATVTITVSPAIVVSPTHWRIKLLC